MSRTTIIEVHPHEKCVIHSELHNSWGSAPHVWRALFKRYVAPNHPWEHYMSKSDYSRLWPLWKELSIPKNYRAVLMFTYDRAYIAKKDYARMANAIGTYLETFPISSKYVNHWPTLKSLFESNPDIPGLGLWCTSVAENPFLGNWNDEIEDYDPIDWNTVYSVWDELDNLERL